MKRDMLYTAQVQKCYCTVLNIQDKSISKSKDLDSKLSRYKTPGTPSYGLKID